MNVKYSKRILLLLLIFYVCINIISLRSGGIYLSGDAVGYYQLALNLMEGHGFSRCDSEPYLPDAVRTPMYPLFMLIFLALFGRSFPLFFITLAQSFLAILILLILKKICDVMDTSKTKVSSLWAVLIFGLSPGFINSILILYSEILLLFSLASAVLFFILLEKEINKSKKTILSIPMGFTLGIMILVKPIMQIVAFFILFYFIIKKRFKETVLILITFIMTMSPWLWRNYRTFGRIDISCTDDFNIYAYTARPLVSPQEFNLYTEEGLPLDFSNTQNTQKLCPATIGWLDFYHAEQYKHVGIMIIKDHWKKYAFKAITNLIDFPLERGPNIATKIFNLDYKKYKLVQLRSKIIDFKFIMILIGAAYDFIYRLIFYGFAALGLGYSLLKKGNFHKSLYILFLFLSLAFILTVSFIMIDDFDQWRLILPGQFLMMFFIPFAVDQISKKLKFQIS